MCSCGRLLHYEDPATRTLMDKMVEKFGPLTTVVVGDRSYRVPRHYIALHGLKAWEVPQLAVRFGWLNYPHVDTPPTS